MLKSIHAFLMLFFIISLIPIIQAEAAGNANLFVSAENSKFNNHFSGSMVIEVVIRDNNIRDTDQGKGEPDVTINGKILRMVQATDGNWYAYFANIDKAKIADSTLPNSITKQGLDFGSICSAAEASAVIGVDLNDADGVAYPYDSCNGVFNDNINVVRKAKTPNPTIPNTAGLSGQIGIVNDTWPFIQLFSFNDVTIQYNPSGTPQRVDLKYDEIPNISFSIDRALYPNNAEVFLTVNDFQLNQDPTDEDSWTFNIESPRATFYQAFDSSGNKAASGNAGLVNLLPHLSRLGFDNNGELSLKLGNVLKLKTNSEQRYSSVDVDGVSNTYSKIVTLVEKGPNSGIFESFDSSDQSVIGTLVNAPRGQTGQIEYNQKSLSVLSGSSSASVSINKPTLTIGSNSQTLSPGTKYPVILIDPDQNLNTGARDHLDVFRSTAIIPTITIGNPVTLERAQNVLFYPTSNVFNIFESVNSSVPDSNSDRLIIDTSGIPNNTTFEMISINLGVSASALSSVLLDVSDPNTYGTNWINYDLRSFQNDLEISNFSNTTFTLYFGSLTGPTITIADAGDVSSSRGFIQIDKSDVANISDQSGTVFLVIDFNSSDALSVSNEINKQPIVFDFFSFGLQNDKSINHSIYRFELEETLDNSSTFDGTFEYAVTNQLNILDPNFIKTIKTIGDEIKIIVTNRLIDEKGIALSYSDLDKVGVFTITSSKSDILTNSGVVSTTSSSYRFGQPVTFTLNDPDLNLKSDIIDIYYTVDNPNSPSVDTVGKDGNILLEILIKDIRYKRCTINGIEYGGLADTGFTLVETGPSTGIFTGVFKMPSQMCDKSGTKLISTAGGSLDAKYYDSRDKSGNPNIFTMSKNKLTSSFSTQPNLSTTNTSKPDLSTNNISKPSPGNTESIILSGSIQNYKRGMPLVITLADPNGKTQNFGASLTNSGAYKTVFTINENSLPGIYTIKLSHAGTDVGITSFTVTSPDMPSWIKNNAKSWSLSSISDSQFINDLEYLVEQGIISLSTSNVNNIGDKMMIPDWVKNNAKWWGDDKISDEDFIQSIQYLIKKGIIRV
ncbi:MAG: peptidase [Nitrosopumilus sp.]|nr:peptidase [Nitrosopumilus sp.]MDH3489336.1 peptidase [Nitrosopumilus sp.]MDH3516334.1 peptidase [Nitrosopumilus sp.]MDH3564099.1 peptidase [Nitrosopumilus sp.]MDH5553931.1 peptidase [Nitrosopumilus sp.]